MVSLQANSLKYPLINPHIPKSIPTQTHFLRDPDDLYTNVLLYNTNISSIIQSGDMVGRN